MHFRIEEKKYIQHKDFIVSLLKLSSLKMKVKKN